MLFTNPGGSGSCKILEPKIWSGTTPLFRTSLYQAVCNVIMPFLFDVYMLCEAALVLFII